MKNQIKLFVAASLVMSFSSAQMELSEGVTAIQGENIIVSCVRNKDYGYLSAQMQGDAYLLQSIKGEEAQEEYDSVTLIQLSGALKTEQLDQWTKGELSCVKMALRQN